MKSTGIICIAYVTINLLYYLWSWLISRNASNPFFAREGNWKIISIYIPVAAIIFASLILIIRGDLLPRNIGIIAIVIGAASFLNLVAYWLVGAMFA